MRQGLADLSISRSSFDWGIKVPWDDTHVVYVWFDALLNYITAVGYGQDDEEFARRWPAQHLVGKDILRFHAVIWPAMLMAAGLEVPTRVFGHGWLLVGGEKMSKSKLTGIAPAQITDTFGSDAFRYYFLRAIHFGQDGSFSWEDLSARYQAELANGFGNLASRVIAMVAPLLRRRGAAPAASRARPTARSRAIEREATDAAWAAIERLAIHEAIAAVWTIVDELNGYITVAGAVGARQGPATSASASGRCSYTAVDGLGALAVLLSPVMPKATAKLWTALGADGAVRASSASTARTSGPGGSRSRAARAAVPAHRGRRVTATAELGEPSGPIERRVVDDAPPHAGPTAVAPSSTRRCPSRSPSPVYDNHTHLEIADGALPLDYHEHLDRAASVGVPRRRAGGHRCRDEPLVGRDRRARAARCSPPSRSTRTRRPSSRPRGDARRPRSP